MRIRRLLTIASLLAAACFSRPGSRDTRAILIRDVTVVDPQVGSTIARRDIVIRGNRIEAIAPTGKPVPSGASVIDGRGKYLIPGLWDMHVHSGSYADARLHMPRLLRQGIVGVRDMGSSLADIRAIRDSLRRGAIEGPHLAFCGPLIQGPLPFTTPLMVQVRTSDDVARVVDSMAATGVDCLKAHDALPVPTWRALARVAKARGIPLVGHLPPGVSAREASAAGQRSIEHLGGRFLGVVLAGATNEDSLLRVQVALVDSILEAMRRGAGFDDMAIYRAPFVTALLRGQSRSRRDSVLRAFASNGTWQTPTAVAWPLRDLLARADTAIAPADRAAAATLLGLMDSLVAHMWRAGVPLLAGTDRPLADSRLVDELHLMVAAGVPTDAVLQTATVNPARFLGRARSGAVRAGYDADLVMLTGDPLRDIRNLRLVHTVIFQGKVILP